MSQLRKLQREDLSDLLALYEHLHAHDAPLPPEAETTRIWERIVGDPSQIFMGAFVDDRVVCACNASIVLNLTRGARPYAVVENVVTHTMFRRQGLAKLTLGALVDECRSHGCYKIMLMSSLERSAGHALYESLGFDGKAKKAFILRG